MSTINEPSLAHVHVHDVMHTGILSTDSSTPLRVAARMMAEQRVHAVAVHENDHTRRPWSIITARDVVKAAMSGDPAETAGSAASEDIITIAGEDRLEHAAWLMAKHSVEHLVVVDSATGHPLGILSALDIVAAFGG